MNRDLPLEASKRLHGRDYAQRLHAQEEPRRLRAIIEACPITPESVVLDVGCGAGPLSVLLGPVVSEYHGVDFSEPFIELARAGVRARAQGNCHFHCEDVVAFIDRHPTRFDRVYALDISEHVSDRDWSAMVAAFARALKPGGSVVLHTPNLDFLVERMKHHRIGLKQFPEHIAVRTASANARFFTEAGFAPVHVRSLAHYNVLRLLHPLSHLPGLGRYFAARLLLVAYR